MKVIEVSIKDILSCRGFPVFVVKSYEINAFTMGYHFYKTFWTPCIGEELCHGINKFNE